MATTTKSGTTATTTAPKEQRPPVVGVVESDKRSKSRTVVVNYQSRHPKYGKYIRHKTVLQAHDEGNTSKSGDTVEVAPCRPVSKTKTWRVVRVVAKAAGGLAHAE
jgi:small subunit ribosomal protein S17